ncbi:MAG: DUF58 domain-containing protein [Planctomycetes bacterium]|nr:DUF58 domain-containing protein [Planctomycetota bacterium]
MIALASHRRRAPPDEVPGLESVGPPSWSLTRPGQGMLAFTLLFWAAGFLGDRNAFVVVSAFMAPLLLLSIPLGRAVLRGLELRVNLPRRVLANRPFRLTVDVRKRRGWLGAHGLRIAPGFLRGRHLLVVHAPVGVRRRVEGLYRVPRRGVYVLEWVRVTTLFPFGLVRHRAVLPVHLELIVHPVPGFLEPRFVAADRAHARGDGEEVVRSGDDEFYGLRDHRAGDRYRRISWRATARLGKLVVREMRAQAEGETDVVLHGRGRATPQLAALAERAVAFTAALLEQARRTGVRLRLEVQGARPGMAVVDAHPHTFVRAMDLLARYGPGPGALPRACGRRRRRHAVRRVHVVLDEPPREPVHPDEIVVRADDPRLVRWIERRRG